MFNWLTDWLIDWLTYWLTEWMIDWLIDWLIDWTIERLIYWLTDWLIDLLIDWLMIDWLIDWLIDWSIDWLMLQTSCEYTVPITHTSVSNCAWMTPYRRSLIWHQQRSILEKISYFVKSRRMEVMMMMMMTATTYTINLFYKRMWLLLNQTNEMTWG